MIPIKDNITNNDFGFIISDNITLPMILTTVIMFPIFSQRIIINCNTYEID